MTREEFIRQLSDVQEPLRRFVTSLCEGDSFKADDIVQDACVNAYLAMTKFRGESRFSTWIFRISYNIWCNRRYDNHERRIDWKDVENKPDDRAIEDSFKYQELNQAVSQLKDGEKAAILLFYMEDKSIKDISSILNVPIGTVKSLLSRGRANLKIKLK